ncbi:MULTISPECIES: nuclear transport factor 2 family protein [Kribbella]|uniref:SnoaL-like domain-containing protein n=1 Tax=Kribbella karoonensis TaxID=324851 RepID=A0ABN2EG66_9ACTN
MLSADDKWAIGETLALHGHLFDEGELDRLSELFTDDVVYDVSEIGGDVLVGVDAVRAAALELGAGNPLAHLVTNVVITGSPDDDTATVRSKGLAVLADRGCGTATYVDTVRRGPKGWRIAHRRILPRRVPLGGLT